MVLRIALKIVRGELVSFGSPPSSYFSNRFTAGDCNLSRSTNEASLHACDGVMVKKDVKKDVFCLGDHCERWSRVNNELAC
ncbi:hypothetical protein Bca4012_064206 [Brassica carinata]